jgi:hypothetical protein
MAAPVPHRAPLSFGDRRVLSSVRGAHVGPAGYRGARIELPNCR